MHSCVPNVCLLEILMLTRGCLVELRAVEVDAKAGDKCHNTDSNYKRAQVVRVHVKPLSRLIISFASGKLPIMLSWLVSTSMPNMIRIAPIIGLKYFRCLTIFLITLVDCEKKAPVIRNGTPSPSEYASSEL